MGRNERRTRWISGWMGLDLFLWRLSSMDVVWFLITSDLTVSVFTWVQGQRRSLDLYMINRPDTRRRKTLLIVGTPEWLSWLLLVFFFSARSGSMLFVEKLSWRRRCCFWPSFAKYDSPRLHLFDIGRITSIPSRSLGGILREQISINGELEKWDDPAPWQDRLRLSWRLSNQHWLNGDDTNRSIRHSRISAWATKSLSQSVQHLRRVQLPHFSPDSEEWIFRARTDFEYSVIHWTYSRIDTIRFGCEDVSVVRGISASHFLHVTGYTTWNNIRDN